MKALFIIFCILSVVVLVACCKVSGDISREEEAKEMKLNEHDD